MRKSNIKGWVEAEKVVKECERREATMLASPPCPSHEEWLSEWAMVGSRKSRIF